MQRRRLIQATLAALAGGAIPASRWAEAAAPLRSEPTPAAPGRQNEAPVTKHSPGDRTAPSVPRPPLRPPRLAAGDLVALVAPAGATFHGVQVDIARESLEALGLRVRLGENLLARYGSLGGRDEERAADLNRAFADPEVKAVLPIRGGWGSARLLPHLDYETIRRQPKVVLGFSDITALLLALHARTGLVTFHGPTAFGRWAPFNVEHMRRVLFAAEAPTLSNPLDDGPERLAPIDHRIRTLTPGKARGRLLGGNLTIVASLVGTPYLPSFDGAILFLEDVREETYRIDRLFTQLALSGVLAGVAGVVFGTCHECGPGRSYGSLTLEEVLGDHLGPLGVPVWHGAMIGHSTPQWTLPLGVEAEIDAAAGTVRLLEPAVV